MNETLYAMEPACLEQYLKERGQIKPDGFKAAAEMWGKPVPEPGSTEAADEIYSAAGDEAVIKIEGALSVKGPDAWDRVFGYGGTSYKTICAAMKKAKENPGIKKVILDINSPGGTVAGVEEAYNAHKELAAAKPTEARVQDLLCSGAYWLAAPAGKILASSGACRIGSIGVMSATYDWTKFEENLGVKEIVITSSNAPEKHQDISTEKGRSSIKAQLDALERIFYARVSEGRGVTAEHIAEHFGKGGLLVASDPSGGHEDAIRAGMIDGLVTHNTPAQKNYFPGANPSAEGQNTPATAGTRGNAMTLNEFLAQNPAAKAEADALIAEAREKAEAGYSARVGKVLPIIQSAAYPANIKTIACNVLAGKEEMAAFTASVAVFDSAKESAASKAAQEETAGLGPVNAEAPDLRPASEKELDAAIQAEIAKRKEK